MRFVFLTACRNEAAIIDEFLREFGGMLATANIAAHSVLYVVDDLSADESAALIERRARDLVRAEVHVIRAPTNLGNQGALFFGLSRIEIDPDDVLITFDCDGEDDVREIPSILALGSESPGRIVLIERGRRHESLAFRASFVCYKALFRFLTRQEVIPNNFLLIPGSYVESIRRSPLAAVHFAYAILKLRLPQVATVRDRRPRYGGKSSQNLFMLASHGLTGLMVFYETVVAKLLVLLMLFSVFAVGIAGMALAFPDDSLTAQRVLLWIAVVAAGMGIGAFGLLMSAALALLFKMAVFTLSQTPDLRFSSSSGTRFDERHEVRQRPPQ